MPKYRAPELVAKDIIEKQLRHIAKKDPAHIAEYELTLALNYFKALKGQTDDAADNLAEVTTEDLQAILNETE